MKKIYKLGNLLILLSVLLVGCVSKSEIITMDIDDLDLIVASDIHYLAEELNDQGQYITEMMANADGKELVHIHEITDLWIEEVKVQKPDIVVITGDLSFNSEYLSHQELASKLRNLLDLGIAVYVLPGNHDIDQYAVGFRGDEYYETRSTSEKEFKSIYADFGYNVARSKDKDSLSYALNLNNQYYGIFLDGQDGLYSKKSKEWIISQVNYANENNYIIILFTHYNLLHHTEMFTDGFVIEDNDEIISFFEQKNVISFSGHMHPQSICIDNNVVDIASSSLATYPFQYGMVSLKNDGVFRYNAQALKLDEQRDLEAKNYFDSVTRYKFSSFIDELPFEYRDEMLEYAVEVNSKIFAGTLTCNEKENELYKMWMKTDTFFSRYINDMLNGCEVNHLEYEINLK